MTSPVDALVQEICARVRYEVFNARGLQQVCYEEFVKAYPPHPLSNPGRGSHSLKPGANEHRDIDLPDGWKFFMAGVQVSYSHTTELPWLIAGQLAEMVREALRRQPFELVQVDARS